MKTVVSDSKNQKIPTAPWRFFGYVLAQHSALVTLAVFFVFLASGLSVSLNYFFKLIVAAVETGDATKAMFYGFVYPGMLFLVQLLYRASGFAGAKVTVGANKTAFDMISSYVLQHSHTYFSDRFAGSVTNKVRNVTAAFDQMIPDLLWGHFNALVMFVVTFGFMVMVDVRIGILFLLLIVVLLIVNQRLAPKKAAITKVYAEAGTKQQGYLADTVANVSLVRQHAAAERELGRLEALSSTRYELGITSWLFTEKLLLINSVILFVFTSVVIYVLIGGWRAGVIAASDFVLILALVANVAGTLLFIGRAFNATARTLGELREGLEDVLVPYEIVDTKEAVPLKVLAGSIEFMGVDFGFTSSALFSDFNLTIAPQERLGVVGTSGAGKSTFVALLLRQYDLQKGDILIDGVSIRAVTQDSLREAIAFVPQEPALFHRTIKENILYGNPGATFEAVVLAATQARAHDFIMALPDGYETLVGERGVKLSGGQKQRIAIARAILKNAPILILDEATSALDSESEVEIQKALHSLMRGKTVIAIAHRLSTLREMDRIIVLTDGHISEEGTHTSLIEAGGLYARLWAHQAGGFLLE